MVAKIVRAAPFIYFFKVCNNSSDSILVKYYRQTLRELTPTICAQLVTEAAASLGTCGIHLWCIITALRPSPVGRHVWRDVIVARQM